MAFDSSALAAVVDTIGGGYPPFFVYPTTDQRATVVADGYFTYAAKRGIKVSSTIIVLNTDTEEEFYLKVSGYDDDDAAIVVDVGDRDVRHLGMTPGTDPNDNQLEKNNVALERIAASGQVYKLPAGETYAFSRGARFTSGSGLVCEGGWCTFLMKTGTGQFDTTENYAFLEDQLTPNPDWINYTSIHRTLFQNIVNADGIVLDGIDVQLEANDATRTAGAFHFDRALNMRVRIMARDFKENIGGVVRVRSCTGGSCEAYVKDLNVDSDTLPFMQVTALEVDADVDYDVASITKDMELRVTVENFTFGSTARAAYNEQTDAFNLCSRPLLDGRNRCFVRAIGAIGPGDVCDFWGSGNYVEVMWDDCWNFGLKMPFGGHRNHIKVNGSGSGLAGIFLQGITTANRNVPPTNNLIEGKVIDCGRRYADLQEGLGRSRQAGVEHEGVLQSSAKSADNLIRVQVEGYSTQMPYAVAHGDAGIDTYEVQSSSFSTQFAFQHVAHALSRKANIRRIGVRQTLVTAHNGTAGATSVASAGLIPYSTEDRDNNNDYDPATQAFTLPQVGYYHLSGRFRVSNLANTVTITAYMNHDSANTTIAERSNHSGGVADWRVFFSEIFYNPTVGAALALRLATSDASAVNITGNASKPFETAVKLVFLGEYYAPE